MKSVVLESFSNLLEFLAEIDGSPAPKQTLGIPNVVLFGMNWRKAPAYASNRGILQQLDAASVEKVYSDNVAALRSASTNARKRRTLLPKLLR
jgi:hypothetical protein